MFCRMLLLNFSWSSREVNQNSFIEIAVCGAWIDGAAVNRNLGIWLDGNVFLKLHIIFSIGTEPAFLCSAGGALWRQYSLAILDYGDVLYRHATGST